LRQAVAGQSAPPDGNAVPLGQIDGADTPALADLNSPAGLTGAENIPVSDTTDDDAPISALPDISHAQYGAQTPDALNDSAQLTEPGDVVPLNVNLPGEFERPIAQGRGTTTSPVTATLAQDSRVATNPELDARSDQQFAQRQTLSELTGARSEPTLSRNTTASFSLETAAPTGQLGAQGLDLRSFSEPLTELREAQRPLQPMADSQRWSSGLSERLLMMTENGTQTARIKLHPEHLGPLDVHITVEDDTARVWFGAQHAQTREALEAALPRLRELFADQGLDLVHTDIGTDRQSRDQDTLATYDQRPANPPADELGGAASDSRIGASSLMMRLVDTWA
jgi:flagellar hook-length control protein FliK